MQGALGAIGRLLKQRKVLAAEKCFPRLGAGTAPVRQPSVGLSIPTIILYKKRIDTCHTANLHVHIPPPKRCSPFATTTRDSAFSDESDNTDLEHESLLVYDGICLKIHPPHGSLLYQKPSFF